jgi:hypothetical protein
MSPVPLDPDHPDHAALLPVVEALYRLAGGAAALAERFPVLFRTAIDEVIDTARSGRFVLSDLEKTEKTYLGTKMEILVRNLLQCPKGRVLDLLVDGVEVDIKNTMGRNWTIPLECQGHIALLLRSNEAQAICDVGLVKVDPAYLNPGQNRDQKRTLSAQSLCHIWWLLKAQPYPQNFWQALALTDREEILAVGSATRRIAALFTKLPGRPIHRLQIEGLARQRDYMKRIRANGGARDLLRPVGIAVLSGLYDQATIHALGLGPVSIEEFISIRPTADADVALLRTAGHLD